MISKYKKQEIQQWERAAFTLYKTGKSLRSVAKEVGKSHEWVRQAIQRMEVLINTPIKRS